MSEKNKTGRVNVALSKTAHTWLVTACKYDRRAMPTLQAQVEHLCNAYSTKVLKRAGVVLPAVD